MKKNVYIIETSHGSRLDNWREWGRADTIDSARDAVAYIFGKKQDIDDRGFDFSNQWELLIEAAGSLDVGIPLEFDEFGVRIVVGEE